MYNGIVNVYKEQGFTSHDVVAKMRGIFGQKKVGHTGTLDPMAEGVLIVCLGKATKLSELILTSRKQYIATMKLGLVTTTDDVTGDIMSTGDAEKLSVLTGSDKALKAAVMPVLDSYIGKSMQIPPMYSAIKKDGKKLYEYARQGIIIEREPRPIEIFSLELLSVNAKDALVEFKVECSKGTYIRSLIRDMGEDLGVGATMSKLVRNEINGTYVEDSFKLSDLQELKAEDRLESAVLPIEDLLKGVARVSISQEGEKRLANGNPLTIGDFDEMVTSLGDMRQVLESAQFFMVYQGEELKALYTYDNDKKYYKVFKML